MNFDESTDGELLLSPQNLLNVPLSILQKDTAHIEQFVRNLNKLKADGGVAALTASFTDVSLNQASFTWEPRTSAQPTAMLTCKENLTKPKTCSPTKKKSVRFDCSVSLKIEKKPMKSAMKKNVGKKSRSVV